jgi:inhibitor of cysteine peptidase
MPEIRKLVKLGENFVVSLEENSTTGYTWEVLYDNSCLYLIKKEREKVSDLIGAGGMIGFTFQARKEGSTRVDFRLVRPWEGEAIRTMCLEIMVN